MVIKEDINSVNGCDEGGMSGANGWNLNGVKWTYATTLHHGDDLDKVLDKLQVSFGFEVDLYY